MPIRSGPGGIAFSFLLLAFVKWVRATAGNCRNSTVSLMDQQYLSQAFSLAGNHKRINCLRSFLPRYGFLLARQPWVNVKEVDSAWVSAVKACAPLARVFPLCALMLTLRVPRSPAVCGSSTGSGRTGRVIRRTRKAPFALSLSKGFGSGQGFDRLISNGCADRPNGVGDQDVPETPKTRPVTAGS